MPYLSPSSSTVTTSPDDLDAESSRPSHRRTRSATPTFSTETGPGAFTPLVGLPRRQRQFEKRTLFQIAPDDDDEQENNPPQTQTAPKAKPQIQVSSPPTPPAVNAVPFPTSQSEGPVESSLPFPSLDPPATPGSTSRASSISRSGSTPIVLANGKMLKPSLKSSISSPQITDWRAQHPRSRSEPSTPLIPKTVHFPEKKDNLENVVLFEKTGRPRAVSGNADDTETETEGYDSPANAAILAGNSKNFQFSSDKAQQQQQFGLEIDTEKSTPVPFIDHSAFANVHVETLVFPRTRPPTLRGSILVKNVAFEKAVALRFTLDNWQTTSEVVCRHVCTLPSLPSPFPPERETPGVPPVAWDRFSFMVRLEDVERKLAERTIFFAARFSASGVGEWWDNNKGANYKLIFRKAPTTTTPQPAKGPPPSPLRFGDGPKRMFPGLDLRPSTMTIPSSDPEIPPLRLKKPFSPSSSPPKSAPSAPSTSSINVTAAPPPPGGAHQRSVSGSSIASSGSSGSLKLSNYASPTSPVPAGGASHRNSISMMLGPVVGGQPISLPPVPPSANRDTLGIYRSLPGGDGSSDTPRRSPANSFISTPGGSTSITPTPTSLGPPFTPSTPDRTPSANPNGNANGVTSNGSSYPFTASTTDSTYAALVEKWCFHQSPAPSKDASPSSEMSTPGLGVPAGSMSMHGGNGATSGFEAAAAGYGSAYGYGHHRPVLSKPLSLKP